MTPAKPALKKQSLEQWLQDVDYSDLDSYLPTEFSLIFMNFVKLVNGVEGESHKTPVVHLKMLDKLVSGSEQIVNLCFRGAAKTTLFGEYLILFLAVFGHLAGFGAVTGLIYVSDSMDNGVKSLRKNIEHRYWSSDFLQHWLPPEGVKFTDGYMEFTSRNGNKLGVKMFGAKTGIRGTKIFGKRPVFAILDDLISDEDAKSKASMTTIKDTVYKGINYALDPTRRKIVFNGTPFNSEDIMIEAVESGAWDVNVWPVCERFPCSREEFRGAWPDRFPYEFVRSQYENMVMSGKTEAFQQELMLQIAASDSRMIQDDEIQWYSLKLLEKAKHNYNYYLTTDFATSVRETADDNVLSMWAYSANGDWLWVDGVVRQQTMDDTVDDVFRLVSKWAPQSVGIEVTGQQQGFIAWFKNEMVQRNIWFNFASSDEKSKAPGIRPQTDKFSRFNMVVPQFKMGKIHFPIELKDTPEMQKMIGQIRMVTHHGIKGKDDCLDTISMLTHMKPWAPVEDTFEQLYGNQQPNDGMWAGHNHVAPINVGSTLNNYVV